MGVNDAQRPARLLSLDGGGIRGLSSIIILKEIMRQVNEDLPTNQHLRPWQVFDLIGGTSTGGIIAMMLGRLQMSVEECEKCYRTMAESIFEPKHGRFSGWRLVDFLKANEKFDSAILERAIKDIISDKTGDEDFPLKDSESPDPDCKVFVCSVLERSSDPVFLRTYRTRGSADPLSNNFKLWEACRATSAASTFFDSYEKEDNKFVDGAFAYNNPVGRVLIEAIRLWGHQRHMHMISIGTGDSLGDSLDGSLLDLAKSLTKLVTETERTADDFYSTYNNMEGRLYFRFNVPGLARFSLEEYNKTSEITGHTVGYLTKGQTGQSLCDCVKEIRANRVPDAQMRVSDLKRQDQKCIQALYMTAGDYGSQRDGSGLRVDGTCMWILEHEKFLNWLSDDAPALLWITGNPGCGKSVLASFLVDELATQRPQAEVCSFFFRDGDEKRTQSHQALCALLHKAFTVRPGLVHLAREKFASQGNNFTLAPKQLWEILCGVSIKWQPVQSQIICIIDALDECSEASRNAFIQELILTFSPEKANTFVGRLKVLLTSRPLSEIEDKFRSLSNIRLKGEDDIQHLSPDIKRVIDHRVKELELAGILNADVCSMVAKELNRRADGTFLWISLVLTSIRRLKSRTKSKVESVLADIPSELDALYASALTSAEPESLKLLQLLLAATRPLSLSQINVALGMDANIDSLRVLKDQLEQDIDYTVKQYGGFFIRIVNSHVYLVHQTAREFLLRNTEIPPSQPSKKPISLLKCNLIFAEKCVRFLLLDDWPTSLEGFSKDKVSPRDRGLNTATKIPQSCQEFYEYAAKNWFSHTEAGGIHMEHEPDFNEFECISKLRKLVHTLCDRSQGYLHTWWRSYAHHSFYGSWYKGQCFLHYAAYHGNLGVIYGLLDTNEFSITDLDFSDFDVLAVAAYGQQEEIVRWILKNYDPTSLQRETALMLSLCYGNVGLVRLLLEFGIDLNNHYRFKSYSKECTSPLAAAIESCQEATLNYLVDRGADTLDKKAFKIVITQGYEDKLRWLLDRCHGQDALRREEVLQSALKVAASTGRLGMIDLITKNGPPLPRDLNFASGLAQAAKRGDVQSLSQILSMKLSDDGSALYESTREPKCLQILLSTHSYTATQLESVLERLSWDFPVAAIYHRLCSYKNGNYMNLTNIPYNDPSIRDGAGVESLALLLEALGPGTSRHLHYNILYTILLYRRNSGIPMGSETEELLVKNLGLVCLFGCLELAKELVSKGADVNQNALFGMPPILAAVFSSNKELVEFLLEQGALTDEICCPPPSSMILEYPINMDKNSELQASTALARTYSDMGEVMEKMTWPNTISPDNIRRCWQSIWMYLGFDKFMETPLSLAERLNEFRIIDVLKQRATEGPSLHTRLKLFFDSDIFLETAPNPELEWILKNPVLIHARDHLGQTPLHVIAARGSSEMMKKLIDHGAILSAVDKNGRTSLHAAVTCGRLSNVEILVNRETTRLLLVKDANERTCLHDALLSGNSNITKKLIELGAPLSTETSHGWTLLRDAVFGAIRSGNATFVKDFLANRVALNSRDYEGRTELHYAVLATSDWKPSPSCEECVGLEVVKTLVLGGSNYTLVDNSGLNPRAYAQRSVGGLGLDLKAKAAIKAVEEFLGKAPLWGNNTLDQEEIRNAYEQSFDNRAVLQEDYPMENNWWEDSEQESWLEESEEDGEEGGEIDKD